MRPPFSLSVCLWCFMVLCSFQADFPYFTTVQWMFRLSVVLPHWPASRCSPISLPVHTSLLSSSHASSTLLTLIRDNHSLIDGTNYLRLKRVSKIPSDRDETGWVFLLFELLQKLGMCYFLILVWPERFCRSAIIVFVVFGIKTHARGTTFHWANDLSSLSSLVCRVFNVSTVEKDVIWMDNTYDAG